jgi:rfaE bifunctional protein kinase chain/domain
VNRAIPRKPTRRPAGLAALVPKLAGRRVLVVADLVVDEFVITGEPRVSREAPVLILKYRDRRFLPGGGANAVANVAALGGKPVVLGEVGNDEAGRMLLRELASLGADVEHVLVRRGMRTPRKTRFLAGDKNVALQQVVRIDRIETPPADARLARQALRSAESLAARCEAVLASDYGLGFVTPELVAAARRATAKSGAPVALDSRYRLLEHAGVTIATPSEVEIESALGRPFADRDAVERAGRETLEALGAKALVLTRGSQGMMLFEPARPTLEIAAFGSGTVADVTGAGDTVIATLTLALAAGAKVADAARLANAAAGIKVTKLGTATVSADELRAALSG